MREQLNNNPLAQLAVLGVLLVAGGFFVMSSMGGGGEESSGETVPGATSLTVAPPGAEAAPIGAVGGAPVVPQTAAPPLPRPVVRAWETNETVALLFVRDGGIDDRLVERTTQSLSAFPDLVTFVAPAKQISRYGQITESLGIDRVPAFVVLTPRDLGQEVQTASVLFGFQSPESIRQAIVDAGYRGRTVGYHP